MTGSYLRDGGEYASGSLNNKYLIFYVVFLMNLL